MELRSGADYPEPQVWQTLLLMNGVVRFTLRELAVGDDTAEMAAHLARHVGNEGE